MLQSRTFEVCDRQLKFSQSASSFAILAKLSEAAPGSLSTDSTFADVRSARAGAVRGCRRCQAGLACLAETGGQGSGRAEITGSREGAKPRSSGFIDQYIHLIILLNNSVCGSMSWSEGMRMIIMLPRFQSFPAVTHRPRALTI